MKGHFQQREAPPVVLKWLSLRKRMRLATKVRNYGKSIGKRICPETADYPTIEEEFNIPTSGECK